jgi:phage gp29-like protein
MPKSKAARKIRVSSEFALAQLGALLAPMRQATGAYSWTLDAIRAARDAQMAGDMRTPAKLAESLRTDDELFAAYVNRLAPARGLPVRLEPANESARAMAVRAEADALFGPRGIGLTQDTIADLNGDIANHGFAIGYNEWTPRDDGTRVDVLHRCWPIGEVRWNAHEQRLETMAEGSGAPIRIEHGDGRWVIYSGHALHPWTKEAAILPAALVWAARAYANRAWSSGANTHGNAKVIGTMPEGMPLQDAGGALTAEAAAFVALLRDVASLDSPVGIKPFGSELEYLTDNGQAWQIFNELVKAKDRAANRIYLGQDVAKATGGSQRLSVEQLFGVRNDVVEGDLRIIERATLTGIIEPWAAINFGDSTLAPTRIYLVPDADEDARRDAVAKQHDAFNRAVSAYRANGFDVTQEYLDALAEDYGVKAPRLAATVASVGGIMLAPTDIAKVVRVDEARASQGLPPIGGERGSLMITELEAVPATAALPTPNAGAPMPPG